MRKVTIAALFFAAPLAAQGTSNQVVYDWAVQNAPHGFDITPDGTIWINLAEVGRVDDYAVRAEDLHAARAAHARYPSFWVRGYHKLNTKVTYRESKAKFSLDCNRQTIFTTTIAYYDAEGNMLWRQGSTFSQDIIPGTYAAEYYRLFCAP